MFEIKHRDANGRIGTFEVKNKKLETPYIFPVINPGLAQGIKPADIKKMGFPGVITNSYIIYNNPKLRDGAVSKGVHELIGFDGVVMTDSGSYQLYKYGNVNISPEEILKFQNRIGSDVGVILDIPTPPDVSRKRAESDLKETIKRGKESLEINRDMLLAGTLQGSTYPDLREEAAREMGKLGFDVYPIGGVVPLMEGMRFSTLSKIIISCKKMLPLNRPVHLFGCGHPVFFAFAVALGCDLFDSAAYALYAKDGRYITPRGTLRLENIYEFPCTCEVCSSHTPKEVAASPGAEKTRLLSLHNLHATMQEIKLVKQSIYDGSLLELVETRARCHPALLDALRVMLDHHPYPFERDPATKRSAFFYAGPESLKRPEVKRHLKRLKNIEFRAKTLVILPEAAKPYSRTYGISSSKDFHVCVASPVFGIVPLDVEEVYPLNMHESPETLDVEQAAFIRTQVKEYSRGFEKVFVHEKLAAAAALSGVEKETFDDLDKFKEVNYGVDYEGDSGVDSGIDYALKLRSMGDYLFGKGAGNVLFDGCEAEIARTGRIRRIRFKGRVIATLRASDGFLILTPEGAKRLLSLPFPKNRVVVKKDAEEFIRAGKSVFVKFVEDCDREIVPKQEVVVVNEKDEFLATGTTILSSDEMHSFTKGMAVRTRHKAGKTEHDTDLGFGPSQRHKAGNTKHDTDLGFGPSQRHKAGNDAQE